MTMGSDERHGRRTGWHRRMALALGALALLAGACGSDDDGDGAGGSGTASTEETGSSSDEQASGGRLVVAVDAEAEGLDPALSNLSTGGLSYASAIFDPLMVATPDGEIEPYLAESMEPNEDFSQWTMTLRPGVTFHDGTDLTADAVKQNIDHHLESPSGASYGGLDGVTVVDDTTLTFDLAEPWVAFPSYLTTSLGLIAAPSMLADPDGAANPVGTGPFVFEEWIPNQHFTASRNPDYWQEGLPYLDEVEFRPIPEYQSRLNALQSGEVDVIFAYGGGSLAAAEGAGDLQIRTIDDGAFLENYVLFNNAVPPFDNEHARRAVAHAIDTEQLNEVLDRGLAEPATGPFSGQDEYAVPENLPAYDPELAAEELAAYTEDTGEETLRFELAASASASALQEAELLQDMLRQADIEVEIRQIEESQLIVSALQGDFQATPWQFDGFLDPDQQLIFWSSAAAAPVGEFGTNFGRFVNTDVDQLMGEARGTADPDERRALYDEVAQIIVDEVPWAYQSRQIAFLAANQDVGGLGRFTVPGTDDEGLEYVQGIVRVGFLSQDG
jgi:ABC-type transport system substrate-binding protein